MTCKSNSLNLYPEMKIPISPNQRFIQINLIKCFKTQNTKNFKPKEKANPFLQSKQKGSKTLIQPSNTKSHIPNITHKERITNQD